MLLNEFFSNSAALGRKDDKNKKNPEERQDELFYYILDHDKMHKDFFIPIGRQMSKDHQAGKINRAKYLEMFKPMIEKGCLEFYSKNKLKGKPAKHFPKELRHDLCERIYDHYIEAIKNDEFQLGD